MSEAVRERVQNHEPWFVIQQHSPALVEQHLAAPGRQRMTWVHRSLLQAIALYLLMEVIFTSKADQVEDLVGEFGTVGVSAFCLQLVVVIGVLYHEVPCAI